MNIQNKKGYSIIEMLVYLALFAAISIVVINAYITIFGSFTTTRVNRDLLESGSTTMERISREIRQAKNIDVVNSTLSSSPGVLQLNSTDSGGVAQVIKFSVTSGALNIYKDGTLVGNLLGQNVSVTSLIFRRITTTNGEAIKIELTLQSVQNNNRSENFYDTIVLRGEY